MTPRGRNLRTVVKGNARQIVCPGLIFLAAAAVVACHLGRTPEAPAEVPLAVFDTICKISQSEKFTDLRLVSKVTEIVLIGETKPIYYFDDFAFPRKKDPRALRLIREIKKQHLSTKIPRETLPQTPCRWIVIRRYSDSPADAPGRFWVMVSPPIKNPLAKRSRQIGVFMRLAWSNSSLLSFGAQRWWIPLKKRGQTWVALEPVKANTIEF
jgi:hypothetical protein